METENTPALLPQYLTALSATFGAIAIGSILGFSSPAAPLLIGNENPNLNLTSDQFNWVSSSVSLGMVAGGPIGGYSINLLGRRGTMIYSVLPFVIGWALIAGAQNLAMLIIGRIINGICIAVTSMVVPTYMAEYASPHIRGRLGGMFQTMFSVGILYAYSMGVIFDSFRWIAGMCGIIALVYGACMIPHKESPVFLLSKGKEEKAKESWHYFRGRDYDISKEFDAVQNSLDEKKLQKISFKYFCQPHIVKPCRISLGLMAFAQFTGNTVIIFNLATIFQAAGSNLSPTISGTIVAVMQVLGTGSATLLIEKLGRKILLIASAFFMAISLACLGGVFYMKESLHPEDQNDPVLGWLTFVFLSIFIVAISVGYGPIPWIMLGELFPPEIREIMGAVATSVNGLAAFTVSISCLPLQRWLGAYGVCWLYSFLNLLSVAFVVFFVMETKGKTLQEIEAEFRNGSTTLPTETN